MVAAIALAILTLVSAAPAPRPPPQPVKNYYHPSASASLCLSGMDGSGASVDGCGSAWGFQNFEFTRGQLRLTNSYNLCLAPESLKNGADIIGYACKDGEYNSWRPGQKRGTIAWKGWCLDNAYGLAEEGNRVQLWRCSSYANKNQVWNLTPAPDLGFPER